MTAHELRIDRSLPLGDEPATGHNRWHPDIPPALRVSPGDEVFVETRDALDGQVGPDSTNEDVEKVDLGRVHALSGPVHVEGAEPGDLLAVDLVDVATEGFGYTLVSPGFGFLRDEFEKPFCVRWELDGGFATSADLPGVRIPGGPFMGIVGVAPSRELLERADRRERAIDPASGPVVLPSPLSAVPASEPIASEALSTIPPRENGGNVDIRQLRAGSRVLLPVFVPGALLSVGDGHFAQGDGEVCGQAIEAAGSVRFTVTLLKGRGRERNVTSMQLERRVPDPVAAVEARAWFATTGLCVDGEGRNAMEDLTLAARNALRNMVAHITAEYGYSREQAYVISSVAVDLKASQLVDVPNISISAFLPLDIFV